MNRHFVAGMLLACVAVAPSFGANDGDSPKQNHRACLVDGKEADSALYVDFSCVRLYACSEACLKQMTESKAYTDLLKKAGREPELIPIKRSHEWTEKEVLAGMALIKGGEFARPGKFLIRDGREPKSAEHEPYKVRISTFYLDKHEVTFDDYCKFLNDGNEKFATGGIERDENGRFSPSRSEFARFPVRGTNYYQAKGYAVWAGKRLPTEAEFEFAHGGSKGRTYPWGEEEPGESRANFGPLFKGLKPVGSFPLGQTPEGVFDLAGNIGEWCADYYDDNYYRKPAAENPVKDPQGPKSGYLRVYRLGCQCSDATATELRGNLRCFASPFRAAPCVGFRCAK